MGNNRIYLSPPHMGGNELDYIKEAFESNWIAPAGPHISLLEKEFCSYTGSNHAVALNSATAALHLSLIMSGVNSGDEVVCSSFTFVASASPIMYLQATPVFVDSDYETWCMDPELLETAIKDRCNKGNKPKAVILVHLYGISADITPIENICRENNIVLIEDAAESLGTRYKGKHTGVYGKLGVFSFNGNKIITTSGGGMLVSDDESLIEQAFFLSTQARDPAPHYQHSQIGYNYRMSNIIASIGLGQLEVLDEHVRARQENWRFYNKTLGNIPGISFMPSPEFSECNKWLTCLTIDKDLFGASVEDIRLALEKENIETRPLWKPLHMQPVFKHLPFYGKGVCEDLFGKGLCIPSGSSLSEQDRSNIVDIIIRVHKNGS